MITFRHLNNQGIQEAWQEVLGTLANRLAVFKKHQRVERSRGESSRHFSPPDEARIAEATPQSVEIKAVYEPDQI
jgi:hypothetical protein